MRPCLVVVAAEGVKCSLLTQAIPARGRGGRETRFRLASGHGRRRVTDAPRQLSEITFKKRAVGDRGRLHSGDQGALPLGAANGPQVVARAPLGIFLRRAVPLEIGERL